jgi:hypothetical protein
MNEMIKTLETAFKSINFEFNKITELNADDFPADDTIEAYEIDGIILSKELRSSPRVVERKEYRFVTYYGKWSYSYQDGEDFDLIEYSDTTNLIQAILDITNIINQGKIVNALEYESITNQDKIVHA